MHAQRRAGAPARPGSRPSALGLAERPLILSDLKLGYLRPFTDAINHALPGPACMLCMHQQSAEGAMPPKAPPMHKAPPTHGGWSAEWASFLGIPESQARRR